MAIEATGTIKPTQNIAGGSFDATELLGFDINAGDTNNLQDGVAFNPDILQPALKEDLQTYLGIKSDKLSLYDGDTVNGFVKIVEAMKAVEAGNATEEQKKLLEKADDFFEALYMCCKDSTIKLDGSYTAGAAQVYQSWVKSHAKELGIDETDLTSKTPQNAYIDKLHLDTFDTENEYFSEDVDGELAQDLVNVFDDAYHRAEGETATAEETTTAGKTTKAGKTTQAGKPSDDKTGGSSKAGDSSKAGGSGDVADKGSDSSFISNTKTYNSGKPDMSVKYEPIPEYDESKIMDQLDSDQMLGFMDKWDGADGVNRAVQIAKEYEKAGPGVGDVAYRRAMVELIDDVVDNIGKNGTEKDLQELATVITTFFHTQPEDNGDQKGTWMHSMEHSHGENDSTKYAIGHAFQGLIYNNRPEGQGKVGADGKRHYETDKGVSEGGESGGTEGHVKVHTNKEGPEYQTFLEGIDVNPYDGKFTGTGTEGFYQKDGTKTANGISSRTDIYKALLEYLTESKEKGGNLSSYLGMGMRGAGGYNPHGFAADTTQKPILALADISPTSGKGKVSGTSGSDEDNNDENDDSHGGDDHKH